MPITFYVITSSHPSAAGMKYVGRTRGTLQERMRSHINHARYDKGRNGALQVALRSLPIDSFSITPLEVQQDESDTLRADHRELELIVEHDGIRNGWNRYTSGGGNRKRRVIVPEGTPPELFQRIKAIMDEIEPHLLNGAHDHQVRARHLLREMKRTIVAFLRASVRLDRSRKQ